MNTEKYTRLEIFAKALQAGGSIHVISKDGECQEIPAGQAYYKWLQIPVEKNTEYEIFCKGCQVSICYLSGCENILDEGRTGSMILMDCVGFRGITTCFTSSILIVRDGPICIGDMRQAGI